jgi:hypothetical protein
MNPLSNSVAALAVASIYYIWKAYFHVQVYRERQLRERVAYLLWVTANCVK